MTCLHLRPAPRPPRRPAGPGGIAIIPTAPERPRNRDSDFLFRHDSYFYYLTGFTEPNAWLVLTGDGRSTLFCQPKDLEREIWDGIPPGPRRRARAPGRGRRAFRHGAGPAPAPPAGKPQLRLVPVCHAPGLEGARGRLAQRRCAPACATAPCARSAQHDLCALLDEMRLIKDAHEQDIMRRAAQISAQAHIRAMQRSPAMLRAGQDVREYHLDAELLHEFRQHGSQYPAYSSIVAAGANACVLHYRADNAPVRDGELVLIDAGCELDGYASDITRTFPANGKFTGPQRALYDLVLASQDAAVAATKAGARFNDPHDATVQGAGPGHARPGLLDKNKHGTLDDAIDHRPTSPLHAPHRPLAGHGRARLRQLRGAHRGGPGQRTQGPAERRNHHRPPQPHPAPRHGADHRARPVRAPRDGRARSSSGTSASASKTTPSSPRPAVS
jgi:Xaa-Pro aminopeptidase